MTAVLCLATSLSGCSPSAASCDDAVAREARERAAREQVQQVLGDAKRRIAQLEARLEQAQLALSQAQYDVGVVARERDDAQQMVDQLRGELGRIARDLRAFSEKNQELAATLQHAERSVDRLTELEAEADERAQLLRDLALVLRDDVGSGEVSLVLDEGVPMVGLSTGSAFADGGNLTTDARRAVQDVAHLVAPLASRGLEVVAAPTGEPESVQAQRVQHVAGALTEAGMPQARISTPPAPPDSEPGWVFVAIRRVSRQ